MSRGYNKVILIGNVGKDPDIRYTGSGIPVATFSLATSEIWRDKDGNQQERTDWHSIVAWRKLAEIIQELVHKGSRLMVEGKLQSRSYEKNGEKRYVTEIVADNVLMLNGTDGRDGTTRTRPDDAHSIHTASDTFASPFAGTSDHSPPIDDLPF